MNERVLKRIIYVWGAISLIVFLAVRHEPLFNGLLKEKVVPDYWDRTKYGELYYFSMIKHFREEGLPPANRKFELSEKHASPGEADILTFGDSFFEFSRLKQFPEKIADDFGKAVHFVNDDEPLEYLGKQNYSDQSPKLVIYERTERFIPVSFESEHKFGTGKMEATPSRFRTLARIRDWLFYNRSEELYSVMLKRSYLTTGLYSSIATLKFDLFGNISGLTPTYLSDGANSWLFYHDQIKKKKTSFYYQHTPAEMARVCDHMADLARKMRERYNLHMVYLPIPAKYTLYHELLNDDPYNEFLPRLYAGLEERGVPFVNIYDDFKDSRDTLFYRTDSHWNQKGLDMAYSKTVAYIQSHPRLSNFLQPNQR